MPSVETIRKAAKVTQPAKGCKMKKTLENFPSRKCSANEAEENHSSEIKGGWDGGRVILRWRKSLWKHVWKKLFGYTCVYFFISIIYRYGLNEGQQAIFAKVVEHFKENSEGVPLTFILGLYIGLVVKRWWDQYKSLPWPDDLALHLQACVFSKDKDNKDKVEKARLFRRSIVRYCLVSYILAIRRQSSRLRIRFQTPQHIVKAGLLSEEELEILQENDTMEMYTSRWWVPLQWCMEILAKADQENLVVNAPSYSSLVSQVKLFKQGLQRVKAYGNLPVPLVYTQVVTLAVYVYFGVALIKDQYLVGDSVDKLDLVYPFFLTFKFMFYYGLLSVAKSIYNPWGIDEEDFQLNKLLSRHLKVAMAIVNSTNTAPELKKDLFWDDPNPQMLDHKELVEASASNDRPKTQSVPAVHDNISYVSNIEKSDPGKNASVV